MAKVDIRLNTIAAIHQNHLRETRLDTKIGITSMAIMQITIIIGTETSRMGISRGTATVRMPAETIRKIKPNMIKPASFTVIFMN